MGKELNKKRTIATRLLIALIGVYLVSLGVALSIRSSLGTTPISSVPYVLDLIFPRITVGTFSALVNTL